MAAQLAEPLLLVGESGTGKTAIVQRLASLVRLLPSHATPHCLHISALITR